LNRRPIPIFLLLLIALLGVACFNDDDDTPPATLVPGESAIPLTPGPSITSRPRTAAPVPTLPPAAPIVWTDCSDDATFDCATYDVPLDYSDPGRNTITLAVRRLPASDPTQRIGALFANPGGPGGSTIEVLSSWARRLPASIRDRFDVILFDPRGVGESSPLVCHSNVQELIGLNPNPKTDDDWRHIEEATRRQTKECGGVGAAILPFLGTESVARDMDRLREAMGDPQLTYFGYSYGTVIGQIYADLFPQNVRAMVLDGAVDVSLTADQRALEQTLGLEASLNRYYADCASSDCLDGDPSTAVNDLVAKAAAAPLPSGRDRPVGPGETVYAVLSSLYSKASWPLLTAGLSAARDGDGSRLLFLVDSFIGRQPDGSYNNSTEMNSAVNCLDYESDRDPQHYRQLADDFEARAPFFGAATGQLGLFCALWEAEPKPLHTPKAAGAPPILVVGSTGDPATPYKWAMALASQLESGVLLTNDNEGHTAYRSGVPCIDDAVNGYLTELQLPPENAVCRRCLDDGRNRITPAAEAGKPRLPSSVTAHRRLVFGSRGRLLR
jgi:pimeloyl-ACP methyl ester carboxylesterase